MKKGGSYILVTITLIFASFAIGLMIGRQINKEPVSIYLETAPANQDSTSTTKRTETVSGKININTASVETLDTLPGIGPTIALRIVEYRTKNGPFTSLSDLTNVDGIGTKTLTEIIEMITLEG